MAVTSPRSACSTSVSFGWVTPQDRRPTTRTFSTSGRARHSCSTPSPTMPVAPVTTTRSHAEAGLNLARRAPGGERLIATAQGVEDLALAQAAPRRPARARGRMVVGGPELGQGLLQPAGAPQAGAEQGVGAGVVERRVLAGLDPRQVFARLGDG